MTHPYKDVLIAIANGEQIQWRTIEGEWRAEPDTQVVLAEILRKELPPTRYRIKPKTIRIGEFDVPEPLREAAKEGSFYWLVDTTEKECVAYRWGNTRAAKNWLELGLLHATEEAAKIHLDALLSFTRRSA